MLKNMQRITSFVRYAVRWLLMFIISFFALGVAMILTIISLPFVGYVIVKRTESTQEKLERNYLESKVLVGYEVDFKGFDGSSNVTGKIFCETDCEMEARMQTIEQFGWLYDFEIEGVKYETNR